MKYFITHVIVLIMVTAALNFPIWEFVEAHLLIKIFLGGLALLISGFFVERVASKWINKLVASIFPDKK